MKTLHQVFVFGFVLIHISSMAQTPAWTQFPNSPAGTARNDDIYFTDQSNGWSARGTDGVYRTTNSGQNWTKAIANLSPVAHFRCIGFASPTRGWAGNLGPGSYDGAVNDTNMLYETFDGGVNWSVVQAINDSGMKGFCAIHVMDSQHIYGAGRVRGPADFAKSENGGATWWVTNLTAAGVMGGLMDVYFKDANNGFVVGMDTNAYNSCVSPYYHGAIARTTNGGLTWDVVANTTVNCSYFWKMSWPSSNIGYVSLQQNAAYSTVIYYKTTDGGATWVSNGIPLSVIGSPASFFLQGIGFINDNEGWMGGTTVLNPPYSFIHTTNGGATWTSEGYNSTRKINRIRFASPALGYMSGETLHVYHVPLAMNLSPSNQTAFIGAIVTFNASAYGTAPLLYQWRHSNTNLPGANDNSLSLTNVQSPQAGNYDLVVSDFSGSITSAVAALNLVGVPVAPAITAQPQNQFINPGSNATFNVVATGTAPLVYQWSFNGGNISAATNTSYTRTNAQPVDAGNYTVRVTNSAGSVTSGVATLSFSFADDFDNYASPVTVTNIGTTNGYKIFFNAAFGGLDFKAVFGYDYGAVAYPTSIVSAPNSIGGSKKGLFLTVNKDATADVAAVNLYPTNQFALGNYSLKFDVWMNWANGAASTETALFGINHSGDVTNRIGLATSDGLLFSMNAEGGSTASSTSMRDYSVFRGGGNSAIPVLMLTTTTFGPTPLLGLQFDNTNSGFNNLFAAKTITGWATNAGVGTPGLRWVQVELRQVNNLITWLLNGTAVAQYTNTFAYTNGSILIGYNDNFSSIGDANSFAIFDNIRVEPITVTPVTVLTPQIVGSNFNFSFATTPYESYTVQTSTNLIAPVWLAYTNIVGNGGTLNIAIPLTPGNSTARYYRVSRP